MKNLLILLILQLVLPTLIYAVEPDEILEDAID